MDQRLAPKSADAESHKGLIRNGRTSFRLVKNIPLAVAKPTPFLTAPEGLCFRILKGDANVPLARGLRTAPTVFASCMLFASGFVRTNSVEPEPRRCPKKLDSRPPHRPRVPSHEDYSTTLGTEVVRAKQCSPIMSRQACFL